MSVLPKKFPEQILRNFTISGLVGANDYIQNGWMDNRVLLYSTGSYFQYFGIDHHGKEYKKEYMILYVYSICLTESFRCVVQINTIL